MPRIDKYVPPELGAYDKISAPAPVISHAPSKSITYKPDLLRRLRDEKISAQQRMNQDHGCRNNIRTGFEHRYWGLGMCDVNKVFAENTVDRYDW
jgi:hypothetical protein